MKSGHLDTSPNVFRTKSGLINPLFPLWCLSGHQSGNKKRHSTETLNILTSDLALEAMDRKQVTALVLLDLSKAFDCIDHMSLLKKLRAMGTSKEAIEWFISYFTGRKQLVRIGCETSEPRPVPYGVPQ